MAIPGFSGGPAQNLEAFTLPYTSTNFYASPVGLTDSVWTVEEINQRVDVIIQGRLAILTVQIAATALQHNAIEGWPTIKLPFNVELTKIPCMALHASGLVGLGYAEVSQLARNELVFYPSSGTWVESTSPGIGMNFQGVLLLTSST